MGDEYKKQDKSGIRYYASSGTLSDYSSYPRGERDRRPAAWMAGVQEAKDFSLAGTLVDEWQDVSPEPRNKEKQVTPETRRKSCLVQRRDSSNENIHLNKKSKSIHFSPETLNPGSPIDNNSSGKDIAFVGLKETPVFESTRKTLFTQQTQQRKLKRFIVDSPLKLSDLGVPSPELEQESLKNGSIGEYIKRQDGVLKKYEMEQGIKESQFHLRHQTGPHKDEDCSNNINDINKECQHRYGHFGRGSVPPPRNLEATEKWILKRKTKSFGDSSSLSLDSKNRESEEGKRKNSLNRATQNPQLSSSEPRRRRLPQTPDGSAKIDSMSKDRQTLEYSGDQSSEELFIKSLEVLGKSKVCQLSPRDYR